MREVLFIAADDLAETVLATGALAHVLTAGDALSVVAPPHGAALLRAAPGLREAVTPARAPAWAMARRFDVVVDAGGSWLGRVVRARHRISLPREAPPRHLADAWGEAAGAPGALAPTIWLDDAARAAAAVHAVGAAPLLVLAPGGASEDKRWPEERFAAVARRLAGGELSGAEVLVLGAGVRDAEITAAVVRSLEADGVAAIDLSEGLDLLGAAALLQRATLCLANDNVLAHLSAAVGAPTLTLFGPTDEHVRAPYGSRTRAVRAGRDMNAIGIDLVEQAALEPLRAGGIA